MLGRKLAHYEIVALLGQGGMGEVYRARDGKLGRDVALKVLPRELSGDSERLARFSREARTLAALQHPNIASIYGFEEVEGLRFLIMELVDGEELSVPMRKGPVPLATALEWAHQIAEGLEAAHEKGIVHRDLKPANIKLAANGSVKILDFGLARAITGDNLGEQDLANSPTITAAMTQQGIILGTAAYMSPEQARGGVADARADIWAFGVILFEMLTGGRLFEGETVSDTLASILKLPPDWSQLPASTPQRIRELLERCLAKKRKDRLASIADARLEIEWVQAGRQDTAAVAVAPTPRRRGPMILVAVAGIALGMLLWQMIGARLPPDVSTSDAPRVLSLTFPDELDHLGEILSPDGSVFAVRARLRSPSSPAEAEQALYIRPLDREEFRRVEGSLGFVSYGFSSDGKWLGLVAPLARTATQLHFLKVPADGSTPPTSLFPWNENWSRLFLWLPDGDLLLTLQSQQILRVPTDGRQPGAPIDVKLAPGFTGFEVQPQQSQLLPGGQKMLTWAHSYLHERYDQTGAVLDLQTGEMQSLIENSGPIVYWPTGHLLFGRSGNLLAIPFDLQNLSVRGTPIAVVSGLRQATPWDHPSFDIARDGTLTYYPGGIGGNENQFFWLDATYTTATPWSDDRRSFTRQFEISADGARLAAGITGEDGFFDIWSSSLADPNLNLWIERPGFDCEPTALSADGRLLLYVAGDNEVRQLRLHKDDGTDVALLDFPNYSGLWPRCFADDNRAVLLLSDNGASSIQMLSLPETLDPAAAPRSMDALQQILADATAPLLSPDGRWLAYSSKISGRPEIYVCAWLGQGKLGEATRLSRDGGDWPMWYSAPGVPLQIRYLLAQSIFAVDWTGSGARAAGPPRRVGTDDPRHLAMRHLSNGRIFALLRDPDETDITRIAVVSGFGQALQRKLNER